MKHSQHNQGWRAANHLHRGDALREWLAIGAVYVAVIGLMAIVVSMLAR